MIKSRRNFIKNLAVGFVGGNVLATLPINVLAQDAEKGIKIREGYVVFNEKTEKNMIALANTLLPGSKEINIGKKVISYVKIDKGTAAIFDAGLWNLEAVSIQQYKKSFYSIKDPKKINRLINHIKVRNRLFYNNFRNLIFRLYYSNPTIWKKLSYAGPPQPNGFMDYSSPPKIKKSKSTTQ